MSRENVEAVRAGYDALIRGDWSVSADVLSPDFEIDDRTLPEASSSRRGLDALRAARGAMAEAFDEFRYEVEEARDLGDRVLVRAHVFAHGTGSGLGLDGTMGHLWTFTDGRASRLDVYGSWQEALEAVGLSE
jgi:ketosteroid isomerase-like protein